MTTIRQIIIDGMREAGIVPIDDTPEAAELEEGLRRLNVLIRGFFGNELGEQLTTVNFGVAGLSNVYGIVEDQSPEVASVYVRPNVRLVFNIDSDYTLYLAPNPQDGARLAVIDNGGNFSSNSVVLDGNGRAVEGAATVTLNTDSLNREWFYRADLGSWSRVTDLIAGDESPLPMEFDDLLTTLLAIRLNPRFGAQTSEEMNGVLNRMRRLFRSRYRQEMEKQVEDGLVFLPSNPYARFSGSFNG